MRYTNDTQGKSKFFPLYLIPIFIYLFILLVQNGTKDLERKLSVFHGREDAILYASCFDANAGLFEAILTADDAIFSDELNHASIIDGVRLCKAQKHRYLHRNMGGLQNSMNSISFSCCLFSFYDISLTFFIDLEEKLKSSNARIKMIVTDGVFSMDGNVAPLDKICELAKKYEALTFVGTKQFLEKNVILLCGTKINSKFT